MFPRQLLQWVGIALIVAILGGLFGWYLFVSRQQRGVAAVTEGRGFSDPTPAFSGASGSMRENIVSFFGSTLRAVENGTSSAVTSTKSGAVVSAPRLWRVSPIPAVGLTSFTMNNGTTSIEMLRYVERPSGNVFEVPLAGGSPQRITNTLIPRVYEVSWIDPNTLILRHAKEENGLTVQTFLASIKTATSSPEVGTLTGSYLDDNIRSIVSYTNNKKPWLFYLVANEQGTFGITTDGMGKNPKRLWSSALHGWRFSQFENTVLLWQKASEGIVGSAYTLSLKTGESKLLLGNKNGLTVLKHPLEDAVLYSTSLNGKTTLFAQVADVTRELPVATFAEKCVWGVGAPLRAYCAVPRSLPSAQLPDAWYRGEVSFDDQWFSVDATQGTAETMLDPKEDQDVGLDVVDPSTLDGKHIFFTDSKTGTVWVLTI